MGFLSSARGILFPPVGFLFLREGNLFPPWGESVLRFRGFCTLHKGNLSLGGARNPYSLNGLRVFF